MAWINSLCVCLSNNTSEASRMKHTKYMNSSFPCLSKRNSALRSYSAFLSRGRSHIQIYSIRCQPLIFPPWNQVARKHQLYKWDKRANYSNLETWSHPIHPSQLLLGQISPPNLETQSKSNHLFCWQIWIQHALGVCRLGSLTWAVLASHKIAPSFPGELLLATCPTPYRLLHEAPLCFPTTWLDSKGKKSQENQVKNVMPFITYKSLSSHRSTHILVEEWETPPLNGISKSHCKHHTWVGDVIETISENTFFYIFSFILQMIGRVL